jgi:iron complex transport system substrate-binding protein
VASASFPITVTDDDGRKVTFSAPPQRIISLSPGPTETLYALGLGDRVIVTDKYSDYPAANQSKAKLDTYPKPNVEQIVALKPDLIVSLAEGDDFFQQMDAQKIPVLRIFPKTFDATLADIELLGQVTGTLDQAKRITGDMREREAVVVAKTKNAPKVTLLYELDASDPTKPFVAGPQGFYGGLIPLAGGKNVFDDLDSSAAQVSSEQIVARNPSTIILGDSLVPYNPQTPAMVRGRPGWSQIDAVKNNRIYVLNDSLLSRPGPRLIDGLEQMAKLLHPELFP